MRIYIVRHGETDANKEKRMQGWSDIPLNNYGIELAVATGQGLKGVKFDAVYTSSLCRAKTTADIILRESGNKNVPVFVDDRIKEIFLGDWEGQILDKNMGNIGYFILDPKRIDSAPNGETFEAVKVRTQEFLRELIAAHAYENVLVSTHGCAMRAMLNMFYEDKDDFWHGCVPKNCAVNIVEVNDDGTELVSEDLIFYEEKQ